MNGSAITRLEGDLATRVQALEAFARQASILQKLMSDLASAESVGQIARSAAEHGNELFGASVSLLFLLDAAGAHLELVSFGGGSTERVDPYRRVPIDARQPLAESVRSGAPLWLGTHEEIVANWPHLGGVAANGAPLQGVVTLPMRDSHAVIGGIAFSFYTQPELGPVQRDLYLTVAAQCGLAIERCRSLERERLAHEAALQANERLVRQRNHLSLVAQATARLTSSLDSRTALAELARAVVPAMGDWCSVDEPDGQGGVRQITLFHRDPAKMALAARLRAEYPSTPDPDRGILKVLRTGETEWMADVPRELIEASAKDPVHLELLRSLELTSYAVVAIKARGRVLGTLTLLSEGAHRMTEEDVRLVEDLAHRAGLALDNARLFEAVEGSRAHLHDLLMRLPAAISILRGPELRYELLNEDGREAIGRSDVLGKSLREVFPELPDTFFAPFERVYATGEPFVGKEVLAQARDALAGRYYDVAYQPTRDPSGAVDGVVTFAFEITEQVLARRRIEGLIQALEATNRDLDQFAYVASHDLKAPLRGISSLAEWIEEDLGTSITDDVKGKLSLLRRRVQRLEALIQGILDFSRVGRSHGRLEEISVPKLLAEVVDLVAPQPPQAIVVGAGMPTLVSERAPLQQVFMNLISNGLKHAGRPDARVEITVVDAGDRWEFRAADNGPGIEPAFQERVWGIFQTLEARDKVENTGIGLAIVKKLVEARGGRAWIESAGGGGGATFCFSWPKHEAERS